MQRLRAENQTLRQSQGQLPDLEAVRERILSGLRVGKQSPEYKRTKAVIDRFISESKLSYPVDVPGVPGKLRG